MTLHMRCPATRNMLQVSTVARGRPHKLMQLAKAHNLPELLTLGVFALGANRS